VEYPRFLVQACNIVFCKTELFVNETTQSIQFQSKLYEMLKILLANLNLVVYLVYTFNQIRLLLSQPGSCDIFLFFKMLLC